MEKKIYQTPKMELMQVEAESQLLSSSMSMNDEISNSPQLSNEESGIDVWGE